MPFLDDLLVLRTQVFCGFKINDSQPLPLDHAEPLFDLIHRVPWLLGVEPAMMTPGLEFVGAQDAPHGRGGDVHHDPLHGELARQFAAVPLGEATARVSGLSQAGRTTWIATSRGKKPLAPRPGASESPAGR
jgi:hypothetical protein